MHSTEDFRSSSFAVSLAGAPAALEDVLPGFGALDRVGVVVRTPGGATGASLLVLAAVTAFYDRQRALADEFFAYPDYFCFHVGAPRGEHGMLDVWPPHKEVVVAGGGEELLRAINDRGVTRLLVEDGAAGAGAAAFEPETLASARPRIVTALAYDPRGRAAGADVEIVGNDVSESYVAKVLESEGVGAEAASTLTAARPALQREGRPVEGYRRIELDEALALLAAG